MAFKGKPLAAKLFLEGKEVPFIGATVTHTVGQAAIAYVDIVPHESINNIKPRTLVHIFVRDFNNESGGFPYILMFEGEVFGINFGKTPSSRTMSISCIDYSSYWDNVLTYFFNAQQSLGKGAESISHVGREAQDAHAQQVAIQAVTHSISSYFLQIIKEALNIPGTDFLDGLVAVYKKISDVNSFYNLAENRLRIVDRIQLKSSGALEKILEAQQALDWFEGIIGRQSGFATLRMVIQDLMSIVFHDFVSVPFPAKVASKIKNPLPKTDGTTRTIGEFIFKPNLYMVPPPSCNIFFPDEFSSFNFSRNFFQEPTRLIYQPEMPMAFSQPGVSLPHEYQPDTFSDYMLGVFGPPVIGDGALEVDEDFGKFGDADTGASKVTNQGKKREQQFLSNEEKMKGIFMAQETMVPATSQFRSTLSDAGRRDFAKNIARYLFFKKRFQERQIQITSHLKPSVVPGFSTLILDASDANQTVVAYCSSVTHRIYATQGGYTNTTLSYARTVGEQDIASGKAGEPLIPPWFKQELFGEITTPPASKADKTGVKDAGKQLVAPKALSSFFSTLLGSKGSKSVNDLTGEATLLGASKALLSQYKAQKAKQSPDIPHLIATITGRDYVTMRDTFKFMGATTATKDLTLPFLEFFGSRISGGGNNPTKDAKQLKARRAVIDAYRKALKESRGFRG